MATAETTTAVVYRELDLQEFVQNATWRELLIELVSSNKLDPWDVDIQKVVDEYLGVVKKMKVLDLRVPANMVLAASILLRLKSDSLSIFSMQEEQPIEEQVAPQRIRPDVEALVPRARMQPKRKVTLQELLSALDQAMKMEVERRVEHEHATTPISIMVEKDDIEEKMKRLLHEIRKLVDRERMTTFGRVAALFEESGSILVDLFVPMLFLAHSGKIGVLQESFFGEIIIKVTGG